MNDDYSFFQRRRKFMKGTGSMVALGSLPAYLSADGNDLSGMVEHSQAGIVLFRIDDMHSLNFAEIMGEAGYQKVALTDDPVRLWRDQLGAAVSQNSGPLVGLTGWADYLMVNGLAAEERRRALLEMQHPVNQHGHPQWASELAAEFLQLPTQSDKSKVKVAMKNMLSRQHAITPGELTLFSWMII
jgi:hypothetical protein